MNEKQNDGIFVRALSRARGRVDSIKDGYASFRALTPRERGKVLKDILLDRAMLIIILFAIAFIAKIGRASCRERV